VAALSLLKVQWPGELWNRVKRQLGFK